MDWKPYIDDRLMARHTSGFVVIKPCDAPEAVPLACPVCDTLYRNSDDEACHGEFGCCARCANVWAYPNRAAWSEGWRPPEGDVRADVERRPRLATRFVVD